jgi:Haemolymph juvenile hormone binding protein (JHBP).
LNSCVIDIIKSLKPRFHQGLPELKIPILEPLNFPLVTLDSSGSQVVNFKANFRNMKLHGAKALDVKDVK